MCSTNIPASQVVGISTNPALIEPVTKAVEQASGDVSANTNFDVIWNNSKRAIFTVYLTENAKQVTGKVLVAWDHNATVVDGIFNMDDACMFYIPGG
ncbi:MAG: hypothetical protein ABSF61_14245 [Anaerolineales bacterium]|jgi:hypothetical protein